MSARSETKMTPARIGPTVCEEEGPMPTEKRSKVEMTACSVSLASVLVEGGTAVDVAMDEARDRSCEDFVLCEAKMWDAMLGMTMTRRD